MERNDFDPRQAHWLLPSIAGHAADRTYSCSQSGTIVDRKARAEYDAMVASGLFKTPVLVFPGEAK